MNHLLCRWFTWNVKTYFFSKKNRASSATKFAWRLKGSTFLKNRHFINQERFNKLIYGINTIIKCGTWQPVKFQLVSLEMKSFLWYLRINVANRDAINIISILILFKKQETNWNFTGCQLPHFMILLILCILALEKALFKQEYWLFLFVCLFYFFVCVLGVFFF